MSLTPGSNFLAIGSSASCLIRHQLRGPLMELDNCQQRAPSITGGFPLDQQPATSNKFGIFHLAVEERDAFVRFRRIG